MMFKKQTEVPLMKPAIRRISTSEILNRILEIYFNTMYHYIIYRERYI